MLHSQSEELAVLRHARTAVKDEIEQLRRQVGRRCPSHRYNYSDTPRLRNRVIREAGVGGADCMELYFFFVRAILGITRRN